jgi:hypothetical protein
MRAPETDAALIESSVAEPGRFAEISAGRPSVRVAASTIDRYRPAAASVRCSG